MNIAFLRTLTGKTLLRLAAGGAAVLLAASAAGTYLLYRQLEQQASLRLASVATERARVAERVLSHKVEAHDALRLLFVQQWPDYQDAKTLRRFEALMTRYPDGAWRNRPELSDGRRYATGWIRSDTVLGDDLRRRTVLFHDLSMRYGPGTAMRHDNLFFTSVPEQSNMGYDPYLFPDWIHDIPGDFDMLAYEWGRQGAAPARPEDKPTWSAPEVDPVGPQHGPMFTLMTPLHIGARHVGAIGSSILLKDFLARVLPASSSDMRYLLYRADGRLLVDTALADRLGPAVAKARLDELSGDLPATLGSLAAHARDTAAARYSRDSDLYVAVARIDGPGWLVAATLPGAAVRGEALGMAAWALACGLGLLLTLLLISARVLQRQVAAPLNGLTHAAQRVAAGDADVRLPATRDDELGQLARSFNDMAREVAERDAALRHDKVEIETVLTSLLRAEQELARQRESLHQNEKLSALGGLLAGVAHELNNPLAVVVGRAMQLEERAASIGDRAIATRIVQAAERCARIVRTFLAMARRQESLREPTDVNDVIVDALDVLAYTLQSGGVQVQTQLQAGLPHAMADAGQLGQVFLNLFTNAHQAMAATDGPRLLCVRSGLASDGDTLLIEVADTGPGIAPDIAARVFEPFFTTKAVGEGTGVGLSVSLGIVQSHGGSLRLETHGSPGARFVVTLPACRSRQPVHALPCRTAAATRGARVLVVDDEREIAEVLRDILVHAGHRVAMAHSGAQALAHLDTHGADLVLTDLKMPGMDGPALYREIRSRHPHLLQRVIAITGDTLGTVAREFVEATRVPVIDKPFAPQEVLARVAEVLKRAGAMA
ncbi:response regulator [Piscinibacter sp. XHJ-5]|uniref:response regulator n=1 Tax=Piscinibacter sp. XHJ-5 TaxID=3037797 RepID=UPI00245362B8|nr:response regulator [Piscinibacter sp. XHJ-5]